MIHDVVGVVHKGGHSIELEFDDGKRGAVDFSKYMEKGGVFEQFKDYYWEELSEGGDEKAQQCGWLKDKYGVSWQVVPSVLPKMINDPNPEKSQRVMEASRRASLTGGRGWRVMRAYRQRHATSRISRHVWRG